MPWRVELVATILLSVLTLSSCGDRRPVWSFSDAAVTELNLSAETAINDGSCRAVLSVRLSGDSPFSTLPADARHSALVRGKNIRLECIGGCDNTETCKTHHRVDAPDSAWATTGCVCDPTVAPPCGLTVQWEVGETSRRRIDRIICGEATDSTSCRMLFLQSANDLQISCGSPL